MQPRVLLQPEDRLLGEALGPSNSPKARRLGAGQHCADTLKGGTIIARLAAKVSVGLRTALMIDAGPLGGLGGLGEMRG
jgi:hypothetical protein